MFLGKIFIMMEGARLRLHTLTLPKLLLWKFSNYSQKNFCKAERVKVKLRKNPYEINDQNTLIMMRCLVLCVIG